MTSQSPKDATRSQEYESAWDAIENLVMEQGGSWSGRERNCAYLNLGDGRFANVSAVSGADYIDDSRAVVNIDWDGDGDLDLILKGRTAPRLRVLRNDDSSGNHYLEVNLVGLGMNRDAIGALVTVEAGGKRFSKRLYAGDGFLSQSPKSLHFGLGDATAVERISVFWPDGSREDFEEVQVDTRLRIVKGEKSVTREKVAKAPSFSNAASEKVTRFERSVRRIPLVHKLPMSDLHIPSFENQLRKVSSLAGGPVLINLWASWCQNCLVEMREFQKFEAELRAQGLKIITMTTDEKDDYPAALEILERYGLKSEAGYVDDSLQISLEVMIGEVLGKSDIVSLPSSLLLDAHGQALVFYNGPVEVETLLADLETMKSMNPARPSSPELFGGVWASSRQRAFGMMSQAFKSLGLEDLRRYYRELAVARRQRQEAQRSDH